MLKIPRPTSKKEDGLWARVFDVLHKNPIIILVILPIAPVFKPCYNKYVIKKGDKTMKKINKENKENPTVKKIPRDGWGKIPTIGENKRMPKNDGWGELPTIGEIKNW